MHFSIKVPGAKQVGTLSVSSPFDGAEVGSVATLGMQGIQQALSNSNALYHNRSCWLSAEQRADILDDMASTAPRKFVHRFYIAKTLP